MKKLACILFLLSVVGIGCQGMMAPKEVKSAAYSAEITVSYQLEELKKISVDNQTPEVKRSIEALQLSKQALVPVVDYFRGKSQ